MKLISLNTWGGKVFEPLSSFIQKHATDTDIFCFQEVFKTTANLTKGAGFRLNLYQEIEKTLPNHQGYFAPSLDKYIAGSFQPNFVDFNLSWGLAIFIKKNIKVESAGDFFVFGKRGSFNPKDLNSLPRNTQFLTFTKNGKKFTIANLHGIWVKNTKDDTPTRFEQSRKIKEFLDKQDGEKILVGDFNLDINTKSIKILESNMINLIKEYHISTTRNSFFPGADKFADYTFTSERLKVINFQVPNIEVSDHLPMILEFS